MAVYAVIFYTLAALILVTTILAVTRRNLVHAVIYLVLSFFGSAMLFYLFGAPLLAALEVIIYAGAIMVLFLFIIMMLRVENSRKRRFVPSQWLPAAGLALVYLAVGAILLSADPGGPVVLGRAATTPGVLGRYVFEKHWMAVEIVSLLLLVALVGALHLGKMPREDEAPEEKEKP
jgi:NADH-quinone oxidoreductase subunit J